MMKLGYHSSWHSFRRSSGSRLSATLRSIGRALREAGGTIAAGLSRRAAFPPQRETVLFNLVVPLLLVAAVTGSPRAITGRATEVLSGDTVVIAPHDDGPSFTCRLYGIRAPRADQPFGPEAAEELERLVLGQEVEAAFTGLKEGKRQVCVVRKGALNINKEMVRNGYARVTVKQLRRPYAADYLAAEREARAFRNGLWQQEGPMPAASSRRK